MLGTAAVIEGLKYQEKLNIDKGNVEDNDGRCSKIFECYPILLKLGTVNFVEIFQNGTDCNKFAASATFVAIHMSTQPCGNCLFLRDCVLGACAEKTLPKKVTVG